MVSTFFCVALRRSGLTRDGRFSSTAPGVEADEDLELEEGEEVGEDELQGQVFGQEDLEEEDEEWADDENNTTMFRMPEDEDGGDDDDRDTLVQEEQAKNSRYEFHPHVKPMDQFHIREVVRIGRHMKAMKGGRQMSFSALVLVGNGNGSAALGYGRVSKSGTSAVCFVLTVVNRD